MPSTTSHSNGLATRITRDLSTALAEQPLLQLCFYTFGAILKKKTPHGYQEYAVAPADIAAAMATTIIFDTGVLSSDILCVRESGPTVKVVSYRKPQKTGIWLEGSDNPLRVALPGMLLLRTTTSGQSPKYQVFSVKKRPQSYDAQLFHPVLPNTSSSSICWGSVTLPKGAQLQTNNMDADWATLLGSSFGTHSLAGKSKKYRKDVRKMMIELEKRNARRWPVGDLLPINQTLDDVLGVEK